MRRKEAEMEKHRGMRNEKKRNDKEWRVDDEEDGSAFHPLKSRMSFALCTALCFEF